MRVKLGVPVRYSSNDLPAFDTAAPSFFVRIDCDTYTSKEILTLKPRRSGPEIIGIDYDKERCPNSNNAIVRLILSREVLPSERFYVKVDNNIFEWHQQEVLADKKTVQVSPIATGAHQFSIWGGKNGEPFFTGAPAHYRNEIINPREPIDFVINGYTPVSCHGRSNGTITINASRGDDPKAKFVVLLQGEVQEKDSLIFGNNAFKTFENLKKGSYTITIHDENGCTAMKNGDELSYVINITEPTNPVHLDGEIESTNPTGAQTRDGKVSFNIGGGDESYQVQVLDSNTKALIACTIEVSQAFCHISGLGAGSFDIVVTDKVHGLSLGQSCGCRFEATVTLTAPPLLEASITEHKPISCYQSNEGQLSAHATGGVAKGALVRYDYAWYNVADMATKISSDSIARNLYQGVYVVQVTDANKISAWSNPFELAQPDSLHVDLVVQHTDCSGANGGGIQAVVSGGTPPYNYQWSESGQQGSEISGLDVGFYSAIVTDSRGCRVIAHTQIKSPSAIDIQSVVTQPNCINPNGGGVELNLSGGSAPYTVLWLDNNTTELKRAGLGGGTYKATITDNKGCRAAYECTLLEPMGFTVALPEDLA